MECFLESRGNRTDKVLLQSFCKWVSIFSDLESIVYSNFTKYLEIPLLEREDAGVTELFKKAKVLFFKRVQKVIRINFSA